MSLKGFVSIVINLIGLAEEPRNNNDVPLPYMLPQNKKQQSSESAAESSNFVENNSEDCWCCVCLSRLKAKDEIRVLPCSHKFHKICVNRWLKGHHKTCPLCRFSMGAEEKSHRAEMFTEEMLIWFSSFHVAGM
ncbi:E3 ubiquitin-protein ligase RHA2A [Cajanus cajan]|uniref:RING-type E3 ubiquitin transferase n=1 Tax=Cajanus cajan TaxID=3821 RepID=A0A151THT7_CAJCA|nr:E3 ubiquitin-protein ligase RHA2A [Cajanus cajan]KYP66621.1 E3 ubiquitin-protein ligase RNF149 family [Cajanus cajan]